MSPSAFQARLPALACLGALAVTLALGAAAGSGGEVQAGVAFALERGGVGLFAGLVVLVAALGLGELAAPLVRGAARGAVLRMAAGLAILLSLSHIMGQAGLLAGRAGPVIACVPLGLGLGLAAWRGSRVLVRGRRREPERGGAARLASWAAMGAITALLLLGVAHAPGTLWNSEFGGYDALEYHLQLPQEWLARGRIVPLGHNVYSFLPGYVEALFYHLAVATGAPTANALTRESIGLLADGGWRVHACQGVHAMLGVVAALLVGALAAQLVQGSAEPAQNSEKPRGERTARLLVLLTPWTIVVATLAYNEMAMLALFAGALLAAADSRLTPARRGIFCGLLVGVACGAKPTALLFCGVPTAIVLLGTLPMRQWWRAALPGALAGSIALAPWMIRNYLACGNPLFPFALTGLLGSAHWNAEQVARFAREHVTGEPWATRLRMLVLPDANDPAGPRHRGLLHEQWGVFFPLVLLAGGHALYWWRDERRRVVVLLWAGLLAQVALWLATTHVQSRFLLPLIVPGACLVAMGVASPRGEVKGWMPPSLARTGVRALVIVALIAQGGFLAWCYASQNAGRPNSLLAFSPGDLTSAALNDVPDPAQRDRMKEFFPQLAVATEVPDGAKVRLLGEAAVFYYPPGCSYNTVWDAWPVQDGVLTDPSAQYVLIDMGSIRRYERSGYLPPGVTPQAIQDWATRHCTPIRVWPERDMALFRVKK